MNGQATAHSVVEASGGAKWISGGIVIAYALLTIIPLVWILLIPFRLVGIAVEGALGLVRGLVLLPARIVRGPRAW